MYSNSYQLSFDQCCYNQCPAQSCPPAWQGRLTRLWVLFIVFIPSSFMVWDLHFLSCCTMLASGYQLLCVFTLPVRDVCVGVLL